MEKYDDASWHFEGDFPEDQPEEHGGTHIAMFLRWCFAQGWAHPNHDPTDVAAVVGGAIPATEFLFESCDGKLTSMDLDEQGNAFAARSYDSWPDAWTRIVGDEIYCVEESEALYQQAKAILDNGLQRLKAADARQTAAKKPWWKFW